MKAHVLISIEKDIEFDGDVDDAVEALLAKLRREGWEAEVQLVEENDDDDDTSNLERSYCPGDDDDDDDDDDA